MVKKEKRKKWFLEKKEKEELRKNFLEASSKAKRDNKKVYEFTNLPLRTNIGYYRITTREKILL